MEHIAYPVVTMSSTNHPSDPSSPKLIIDSDWKSQAQAEKDRLAAKEAEARSKQPAAGGKQAASGGQGHPQELPKADFQTLVGTLVSQALMYMGAFPDPETGRAVVSLEYARFHIDLIAVLEEKTKGNISTDEAAELKQVVAELRMRYVDLQSAVTKAMADQMARKAPGMPG